MVRGLAALIARLFRFTWNFNRFEMFDLVGSLILILFTSLDNQSRIIKVFNPSLKMYNDLDHLYPERLDCRCSIVTIPYEIFVSLSPRLHEICFSDFVDEVWIEILMSITYQMIPFDWLNHGGSQFQLNLNFFN